MDGDLRALFRRKLPGWHWNSIESGATGSGIPDSEYCAPGGQTGWVEFKQTAGWAVTLRPAQVGWLTRRCRLGGRAFIAVRRRTLAGPRKGEAADELWLLRGTAAPRLKAGGLKAMEASDTLALFWGGPGKWRWKTIELILRGAFTSHTVVEGAE